MDHANQLSAAEEFLHREIPLTNVMGVRVVAADRASFTIAAPVALNYNHLRTAFGGSINAVATLAAYGYLWFALGDKSVELVIAESSIRFLRPIRETIQATCRNPGADHIENFKEALRAKGKARITLHVSLEEDGKSVAEFQGSLVALTNRHA